MRIQTSHPQTRGSGPTLFELLKSRPLTRKYRSSSTTGTTGKINQASTGQSSRRNPFGTRRSFLRILRRT